MLVFSKIFEISKNFRFGWGALPPRPPGFWLGGQSPPRPPPERPSLAFDRGGQTGPPRSNNFFFGAADDTRAADDRPAGRLVGRPAERPAERPTCRHVVASSVPISSPKLKIPIHLNYNPPFWPW